MGNFYTNITLTRTGASDVEAHLRSEGRLAFLVVDDGRAVVFDAATDDQDVRQMHLLTARWTLDLGCDGIAVLNHDDDILVLECYERGENVASYNSRPDYFEDSDDPPLTGDVGSFVRIAGSGDSERVEAILQGDYVCEVDRHIDLWNELRLPLASCAYGFTYLDRGEQPENTDVIEVRPD